MKQRTMFSDDPDDDEEKGPYNGLPPFVSGSDTSQEAAFSMRKKVGPLCRKVYGLLRRAGSEGMTCDHLEEITEIKHQTISARVRELVLKGYIHDSGERRKTRSGRNARVYKTND